jgi:hypothetical protein
MSTTINTVGASGQVALDTYVTDSSGNTVATSGITTSYNLPAGIGVSSIESPDTLLTPTLPPDTYTIQFVFHSDTAGANFNPINVKTAITVTQVISPALQSALDAINAALLAQDSSDAAQFAALGNDIAALQAQLATVPTAAQLAALQGQVATDEAAIAALQSQMTSLTAQVGKKEDQQSLLQQYGPALGAGAIGLGSSFLFNELNAPQPHSAAPNSVNYIEGARPGYGE